MNRGSRLVAGWSRTRLRVAPNDLVLDVGCGAFPNDRADIAIDRSVDIDRHRTGRSTVVDRPFVMGDAERLPFRTGSVDLVIASHIAEHVDSPGAFCAELSRVASRGYVETPSPVADVLLHEDYHRWRVSKRRGRIRFAEKGARTALVSRLTDAFYAAFYAGRSTGESRTSTLPAGRVGLLLDRALYLVRGGLNRTGVMHTRVHFDRACPLRWSVRTLDGRETRGCAATRPSRVLFVDRAPSSGFMATDRDLLERLGPVEVVTYPGRPTPGFVWRCAIASRRCEVIFVFFASEHAVLPAILARAFGRRLVVVTGGYDTANVPEHHYGLAARGLGFLPRMILRQADVVLPFSATALNDLYALDPDAARRAEVIGLAIDPAAWPQIEVQRVRGRVVTVGYVDEVSFRRKGIDRFVELARSDPGRDYIVAGRVAPDLAGRIEASLPTNLQFTGFLPQDELVELLWSADLYAQLSWHEGFGLAVAEAMACGCVPVVSDVPALVEVAGRWGIVASGPRDLDAIERGCAAGFDRGEMRADILARYSPSQRAAGLERAVHFT
jgi:glycosyltransferase involved in cell wall biosynthesis